MVRQKKYLQNPKINKDHENISGEALSTELVAFYSLAESNMRDYIKAKIANESCVLVPIYVTKAEEEEALLLENKTVKKLKVLIFQKLESFPPEMQVLHEDIYRKTVKNKSDHIEFLYQLFDVAEDATEAESMTQADFDNEAEVEN